MAADADQLSFLDCAEVLVYYDPERQPPDATGPGDSGTFKASLRGPFEFSGLGRSEQLALAALAGRLRPPLSPCPAGVA